MYWAAIMAVSLALASAAALADEMPHYDVEANCKRMAEQTDGGQFMLNACLRQEQTSYDKVKAEWQDLPIEMRNRCDRMAQQTESGYFMLNACIDQERRAAAQNESFTFQR